MQKRNEDDYNKKNIQKIKAKILILLNLIALGFILGSFFEPRIQRENLIKTSKSVERNNDKEVSNFMEGSKTKEACNTTEKSNDMENNNSTESINDIEEKICYLTFDDGPSKNTEVILDILKEYNAKATFFVIGNNLTEENFKILERIKREGHVIGLHANDHTYTEFYKSEESWKTDLMTLKERLETSLDISVKLYRFPGGSACTYIKGDVKKHILSMREEGYTCFDWNVSGEDAVGTPTPYSIYHNVMEGALKYNTPIVLLHDAPGITETVEALPMILEEMTSYGYSYETLESRKEYIFKKSRPLP